MKTIAPMLLLMAVLAAPAVLTRSRPMTSMTPQELAQVRGQVWQELKGERCGVDSVSSSSCTYHYTTGQWAPAACWGGCGDGTCVSTDLRQWCGCSVVPSDCDKSSENGCTGGTKYDSPNGCDTHFPPCQGCNYAANGSSC